MLKIVLALIVWHCFVLSVIAQVPNPEAEPTPVGQPSNPEAQPPGSLDVPGDPNALPPSNGWARDQVVCLESSQVIVFDTPCGAEKFRLKTLKDRAKILDGEGRAAEGACGGTNFRYLKIIEISTDEEGNEVEGEVGWAAQSHLSIGLEKFVYFFQKKKTVLII